MMDWSSQEDILTAKGGMRIEPCEPKMEKGDVEKD